MGPYWEARVEGAALVAPLYERIHGVSVPYAGEAHTQLRLRVYQAINVIPLRWETSALAGGANLTFTMGNGQRPCRHHPEDPRHTGNHSVVHGVGV
jgi:hypothetical protein